MVIFYRTTYNSSNRMIRSTKFIVWLSTQMHMVCVYFELHIAKTLLYVNLLTKLPTLSVDANTISTCSTSIDSLFKLYKYLHVKLFR